MNGPLLILVTVIYFGVAIEFYRKGDVAMAWVFLGYTIANGGFIYQAMR